MVSGHNSDKGKGSKNILQAANGCVWYSESYEVRLIAKRPKITGATYWKALADVLGT